MSVFVDTSALFAILDADDQNHEQAKQAWVSLITQGTDLVCTSYILVEAFALVQRRLGMEAVRVLQEDMAWLADKFNLAGRIHRRDAEFAEVSMVEVGTALTGRPPHRTGRAAEGTASGSCLGS